MCGGVKKKKIKWKSSIKRKTGEIEFFLGLYVV